MSFLRTKLNRISEIIRERGFWGAWKLIFPYAFSLLRLSFSFGKGDVLFVVSGGGATSLYRGHNVAEELEMHGLRCKVVLPSNIFLKIFAKKFQIFVFHRTIYSQKIQEFVEEIKKQNKEIIFETDDLLFDPKYLDQIDYLKNITDSEKEIYENGLGGEILRDPYVKSCTTTTEFLKKELESHNKKVFLVRNKINNQELNWANEILEKRSASKESDRVKMGYFSGTMSHNKDFKTIVRALEKIMEEFENTELHLAGPLEKQNTLLRFGDRIKVIPFSSRRDNYKNIAKMDVNLFPLEIGNPFCEAKSELKFFEAGILGVPTIASGTKVLEMAIEDGKDGFVAANEDEWFSKLKRMIEDLELRKRMGVNAREKSLKYYTNKNSSNEEYYNFLKSKIRS